jgi:predicted DNA-binding transcriptional regulator YafY
MALVITYKSFMSREENKFHFHPFILKEFNNRWFLVGRKKASQPIANLALDRIVSIDYDFNLPFIEENFDAEAYYHDVVGVTVNQGLRAKIIEVWIDADNAPYVLTKPFHHSQKLTTENDDGSIIITLNIKINYEIERLLLGFADGLEVIGPESLRKRMKDKFEKTLLRYD